MAIWLNDLYPLEDITNNRAQNVCLLLLAFNLKNMYSMEFNML